MIQMKASFQLERGNYESDETKEIARLRKELRDTQVALDILKKAIGIPEEEQIKIVKAFYMVDKSRARSKNGAGLGLALCTEILKIHHSGLQIESKEGEGSCFSFVLAL